MDGDSRLSTIRTADRPARHGRSGGQDASALAATAVLFGAVVVSVGVATAAPPASATQGITATTIRIGVPYVDLSTVRKFGITLDQGNFDDAYRAIVKDTNAHGGVNGRTLVPYLVAVNPVGTAPAATACTQLASEDKVFVAIAPQQPDCFLRQYGVPTISGSFQNVTATGGVPNFTLSPPLSAYDPVQLAASIMRCMSWAPGTKRWCDNSPSGIRLEANSVVSSSCASPGSRCRALSAW